MLLEQAAADVPMSCLFNSGRQVINQQQLLCLSMREFIEGRDDEEIRFRFDETLYYYFVLQKEDTPIVFAFV